MSRCLAELASRPAAYPRTPVAGHGQVSPAERPHGAVTVATVLSDPRKLLELVDRGDFDGARELVTTAAVADAWLAYQRDPDRRPARWDEEDHPLWWAVQWLYDEPDDKVRRELIELLADRAKDEFEMSNVGAGPLEAYLSASGAPLEDRLEWVEECVARSTAFRTALANVYFDGLEEQWERLDRAAGSRLPRPTI